MMSKSPPAREAWIEIGIYHNKKFKQIAGRLPQGRRGLKYFPKIGIAPLQEVASRKGGVD